LTPELVQAGLAREVVRTVQERRKASGLDVSDRIALAWHAEGALAAAIRAHAATIGAEVLATAITEGEPGPAWVRDDDLGLSFAITRS
jgi:isoleucyl-tRNA synthetase